MRLRLLFAGALPLALCGCLSVYTPAPNEATATIDVTRVPEPGICTADGKRLALQPDQHHQARIPANAPLTLFSVVQLYGYNVTWRCVPAIGFTPETGKAYYGSVETRDQRCHYEVYRAGASNRIGLELEPTIGRSSCPTK